jgi:prepilin-type N-terminal cleavage/methylation domain-containing protein
MRQSGMTLVELLVVVVLASFIGFFVMNLFITSNHTYMDQNKVLDAQRDGRLAMDYIARTLREAGLNPHNSPDFNGIWTGSNAVRIKFDRDFDYDGELDTVNEIIEFSYQWGMLKRGFDDGEGNVRWQDIAKNVTSFNLAYFDENGDPVAPDANVQAIRVSIGVKDSKHFGGDFTRTYSTRVYLRNL